MKKKENRSKEEHTCLPVQWCCCSPVVILESLELFFRDVAVKKKEKTTYTHKKRRSTHAQRNNHVHSLRVFIPPSLFCSFPSLQCSPYTLLPLLGTSFFFLLSLCVVG